MNKLEITLELEAIAERFADIPVVPYEAYPCPECGGAALVCHNYLGGYGEHRILVCTVSRRHRAPLTRQGDTWVVGRYAQEHLCFNIVPVTSIS